MTPQERESVEEMRKLIREAPKDVREQVEACAERIRQLVKARGDVGVIALVMVAAEYAEADDA